ncbi:MAG: GGDEF domain-containing protein [Clostridiales bacterium]|nr:GGDEF domain-containing protein [Clostridiales bacterium]
MWSCTAFSLIIAYNFMHQRMINLDDLTGVWNRGTFSYYMSHRAKLHVGKPFGVILIDLDGLKQINDRFGHFEGDEALVTTARLLRTTLRRTDIAARMGGDEFIILVDCDTKETLDQLVVKLKAAFAENTMNSGKPYSLKFSYGAELFDGAAYADVDRFLHHVDDLLYENKKAGKQIS